MPLTPAYAAAFALFYIGLSVRTLLIRRELKVAVGDGDSPVLRRAIRVHSNFIEYVPLAIILISFRELQGAARDWIHILCLTLLVGRLVHAYGVSQVKEDTRLRVFGMAMTFTTLMSAALWILSAYV